MRRFLKVAEVWPQRIAKFLQSNNDISESLKEKFYNITKTSKALFEQSNGFICDITSTDNGSTTITLTGNSAQRLIKSGYSSNEVIVVGADDQIYNINNVTFEIGDANSYTANITVTPKITFKKLMNLI